METMNITKNLFTTLLLILSFVSYAFATSPLDQERTLEVSFSFTPPTELEDSFTGYQLFKGTTELCSVDSSEVITSDPTTSVLSCTFLTEDGTFDFTLSAVYSDGSSSPLSPAFPYTIGTDDTNSDETPETTTPRETTGSKTITYSWLPNTNTDAVIYSMYMNDTMICSTSLLNESTSCSADLINSIMEFSITSTNSAGEESSKSNILTLDPLDFPELFENKKLTFDFNYNDTVSSAGGFRVYDNGELLCETTDSTASQIICDDNLLSTTNVFAIKAIDANGVETDISNTITYTQTTDDTVTEPDTTDLFAANITTSLTSGDAPLTVTFDASDSTGYISSYSWQFGDGSTDTGALTTHTFNNAGNYTTTLIIEGPNGTSKIETVSIAALPSTEPTVPPTAIISSSTAAGNAPLEVTFDASGSLSPNLPITSFDWTFGDGTSGSGAEIVHTYNTAGTYYATVTVTDSNGQTDTVSTPVLITGESLENELPLASMIASPSTGSCPITVYLDGSASSDPDGSIANYSWNLGDGTTASGSTAQHTYTTPASYNVSLEITDNMGATTTTTQEIRCTDTAQVNSLTVEVGELNITHEWVYVTFEKTFISPVVIAGPPTFNEDEPVVVRIRNITKEGFEIRLQEWDYLNDEHDEELVSYIVIEQGQTALEDGSTIEAGYIPGGMTASTTTFQQTFTTTPIVLTTISTVNDSNAVTGRIKNVSTASFDYILKEEGAADQIHQTETVAYIAWQSGKGNEDGLIYESGVTTDSVNHDWSLISMQNEFTSLPYFFAMIQTLDGGDTTALRQQNLSMTGFEVKAEEEQSSDSEMNHTSEVVGYLVIGAKIVPSTPPEETTPTGKNIAFAWDFTGDETSITGFRFYMNDSLLCETTDPTLRQLSCNALLPADKAEFSMTSIGADDTESSATPILSINSTDFPALFNIKNITYIWDFDIAEEGQISGFNIYNNGKFVCAEFSPSARIATCNTAILESGNNFTVTAIETTDEETNQSNTIRYQP